MLRLKSKLLPTVRLLGERTPCPGIVGRAEGGSPAMATDQLIARDAAIRQAAVDHISAVLPSQGGRAQTLQPSAAPLVQQRWCMFAFKR